MGDLLSTPSKNPSETQHTTAMTSSETSQNPQSEPEKSTQESETLESHKYQTPEPTSDPPSTKQNETLDGPEQINVEEGDQEGEEEEGECGFCLYMKGGGCRESFTAWEKCIEEAEKNKEDIVDKCFEVTGALKKCMEAHTDYYGPILQAEKAAEAEAVRELEKEKEKEAAAASSEVNSTEGLEEQVSEKS